MEECFFENHEHYLDLQIVLEGKELFGYTDISITSAISLGSDGECFWEKDLAPGEFLNSIGSQANNTFTLSFDDKSYAEMRIANTFVNWNFKDIWGINERVNTPYLKWEI